VAASCALDAGIARRLSGDRAGALAKAREVGKTGITDPRVLGTTAQLLANLGEIDEAAAVVARAAHQAATSLPAIAWAQLAVRIGRSEVGRPAKHLLAVGSESRLVAARAALANGEEMGITEAAATLDPDLRWLATLARATERRDAALFSDRLETEQPNPGPVGAYVAGMMARRAGRRHLAERWLRQALTGHGDTCRAAREYKETQRQLRRDEWRSDTDLPLEAHNKRCRIE
jgi:murein DD-endopeptidase MepM/ murein hydrolase activator NlpD